MATFFMKETAKAKGLHKRDRAVLRELADVANKDGTSWWEQKNLAARMGLSERTVRTALKSLEAIGWISRERRWRPNGSRSSDLITVRTFDQAIAWALANTTLDDVAPVQAPAENPAEAAPYHVNTSTRQPDTIRPIQAHNDPRPVEKIHQELMMRLQGESLEPPVKRPADDRKAGEP